MRRAGSGETAVEDDRDEARRSGSDGELASPTVPRDDRDHRAGTRAAGSLGESARTCSRHGGVAR